MFVMPFRTAIECTTNIGYSKLRITFDTDRLRLPPSPSYPAPAESFIPSPMNSLPPAVGAAPAFPPAPHNNAPVNGPLSQVFVPARAGGGKEQNVFHQTVSPGSSQGRARTSTLTHSTLPSGTPSMASYGAGLQLGMRYATTPSQHSASVHQQGPPRSPPPVVGDVAEPFWVQSPQENSVWCDPDELFLLHVKRKVTLTDKRMFWEMARALIELPELSLASHDSRIRNASDLTRVLVRPEYKVLWIAEAAQILPKEVATELIRSAYVVPDANTATTNGSSVN